MPVRHSSSAGFTSADGIRRSFSAAFTSASHGSLPFRQEARCSRRASSMV